MLEALLFLFKKKKKKDAKASSKNNPVQVCGFSAFINALLPPWLAFEVWKQAHAFMSTACVVKKTRESQRRRSLVSRHMSVNREAMPACRLLCHEGKRSSLLTQDIVSLSLQASQKLKKSDKFWALQWSSFFFYVFKRETKAFD